MNPYEQYLLNEYQKPTVGNNPFSLYGEKAEVAPRWDTSAQIQGELANKPAYNSRGERYGNTLSDDMIDIKNGRRGNPETTRHPWIGDIYDYTNNQTVSDPLPVLENVDYTPAVLRNNDFRDNAISRKKFYDEGNYDWYGESPYIHDESMFDYYDPEHFRNPDMAEFVLDNNNYDILQQQINSLRSDKRGYLADSIGDDVRYIKSEGRSGHFPGVQAPRYDAENDPALPTYPEDAWGLLVNPERLSPATAKLIAQNTTKDRPATTNYWGEEAGMNPLINAYRKMLGMENPIGYAGGQYYQGAY